MQLNEMIKPKRHYWKKLFILLLIATTLILLVKMFFGRHKNDAALPNKLVEVETITLQPIQQTIRLVGTIHSKHATVLTAKGTGRLDAIIPSGKKIKKGELIAKIDNLDLEKNLQLSIASESLANTQVERIKPLAKPGYVSAREIAEKKQALISIQKDVAKTRIELDNLRFYAPFDGIVGAYKTREGTQVKQGEAVVSLYDPSSLVVDFDVPCSHLSGINEGQKVSVLGQAYRLTHLQKMIDDDSHMCPADVDIRCDDCLIGASVDVELEVAEKKKTIVIPFQALFLRNGKPFVYIVEKGKIALVPVKTGIKQQDKVEILSGLKPGQQLIIKGQERLYPGLAVDIYHPTAQKKAG